MQEHEGSVVGPTGSEGIGGEPGTPLPGKPVMGGTKGNPIDGIFSFILIVDFFDTSNGLCSQSQKVFLTLRDTSN